MKKARLDRAGRQERTLDRRAARAQRSRWLGRLLFSLIGMALLLVLRMKLEIHLQELVVARKCSSVRKHLRMKIKNSLQLFRESRLGLIS